MCHTAFSVMFQTFVISDTGILEHGEVFVICDGIVAEVRSCQRHIFFHGFHYPKFRDRPDSSLKESQPD